MDAAYFYIPDSGDVSGYRFVAMRRVTPFIGYELELGPKVYRVTGVLPGCSRWVMETILREKQEDPQNGVKNALAVQAPKKKGRRA